MRKRLFTAWVCILVMSVCVSCAKGAEETQNTADTQQTADADRESAAAKAASMKLSRAEGSVTVKDRDGAELAFVQDMGLYDGYRVGTEKASCAWLNLDDTKLTKMDAESRVRIGLDGRKLELFLESGTLLFNITKPLETDESYTIRNSSMIMGVRGTVGWTEVPKPGVMYVYVLEGTVECSVTDRKTGETMTEYVSQGEMARITDTESSQDIFVAGYDEDEIPPFVIDEIWQDDALRQRVSLPVPENEDGTVEPAGENETAVEETGESETAVEEVPYNLETGEGSTHIKRGNIEATYLPSYWGSIEGYKGNVFCLNCLWGYMNEWGDERPETCWFCGSALSSDPEADSGGEFVSRVRAESSLYMQKELGAPPGLSSFFYEVVP